MNCTFGNLAEGSVMGNGTPALRTGHIKCRRNKDPGPGRERVMDARREMPQPTLQLKILY